VSTNKCDIDGQPEIAVWPSKLEVLISPTVWQTSLQFRQQTFYQGEFIESVNRLSSSTTGNSDVAAKTGNSYITVTTTDSVEITTASQVFLTIVSPNKVPLSDCDNVRQSEMALRPLKPEIFISLEPWQVGWQFQRQMRGLRPRPAQRNWPRAIATTTDNRKWKHRRFRPQLAISDSRSLSKSFGYTFIQLVIIENPEFVVGISMLSVIVPEI